VLVNFKIGDFEHQKVVDMKREQNCDDDIQHDPIQNESYDTELSDVEG
jgi:hypothetical protein